MAVFNDFTKRTFHIVTFKNKLQFLRSNYACLQTVNKICTGNGRFKYRSRVSKFKPYSEINLLDFSRREIVFNLRGYCSKVNKETSTSESILSTKFSFQEELKFRKSQAERSVMITLPCKADVPYVTSLCRKFGDVEEIHTYVGENDNVFFLVEFINESEARKLFLGCQHETIADVYPVSSRILKFQRNGVASEVETSLPQLHTVENDPTSSKPKEMTVSQLIIDVYKNERLTEIDKRLRFFLCILLKDAISGLFPYSDIIPFGSSVNGFGRRGCDLDVMIRMYPEKVSCANELYFLNKTCIGNSRTLQQRTVLSLGDLFRTFLPGITNLHKIVHARVPIMKFRHQILGIDCDASINNMSAIYMSELLHYCGEIDTRVRPLIYSVKKWAKEANITYDTPGTWITNFSLTLLVLYFLQNRPVSILPPLNDAVSINACRESTSGIKIEYFKSVSHWEVEASSNKESLAQLLMDFLIFLATFPFGNKHISVLTGKAKRREDSCAIWIQYPFEEDLNVSKNVSDIELRNMCNIAHVSSKYLAPNMHHKVSQTRDLITLLGIQTSKRQFPNKIDVAALLAEDLHKKSKRKSAFARGKL